MSNYVAPYGNASAKLIICGEAPGRRENETGQPFSGPSGELVWELAEEIGFTASEVWTTNVYKYQPPYNNIRRIAEVCNPDEQISSLWQEINEVNPNCILALGDTAFRTLRGHPGITRWRGSILKTKDGLRKMVGSIHPANIIRSAYAESGTSYKTWPYIWRYILKLDMQRAWEEASSSQDNLPKRYVHIAKNSADVYQFFSRFSEHQKMAEDIESSNCIPICAGFAFNKHEALVVPLFNRMSSDNPLGMIPRDQIECWRLIDKIHREKKIIGQNFKYDQDKLEMIGFEFNKIRPIWSDTLIKAHTIIPELPSKRMEMLQSLWTKMPYHKDEGKQFNPKKDKIERLWNYNGLDALSTYETDETMEQDLIDLSSTYNVDLIDYYYNFRMLMHEIYLDMENIGFLVDESARSYLRAKYSAQHDLVQERFRLAAPDFTFTTKKGKASKKCHKYHVLNVAAHEQIRAFVYDYLDCPRRYERDKNGNQVLKVDEDTIVRIINTGIKDERRRVILSDIIEDRRIRKTLGTYVNAKTDFDGRIRGTYRIFGPETGRSASQKLKPPIRPDKFGHAFQTLTKHGTIGADIRSMYIPDKGFVFVQCDLSQAEPRIVANLSEDWELLKAFQSGKVDIHRRTAALVLDKTPTLDLSEEYNEIADKIGKDSPERFLGKKSRNGGNYGMGPRELATNINSDAKRFGIDIVVSEWRTTRMVENFHRESPKIRGIFQAQIIDCINSSRAIIRPYKSVRQFFGRLDNQTYKEGFADIPQNTVADHVKYSLLGIRKEMKDFSRMLMGESHDALLWRFPKEEVVDRAKIVKKVMETPIDFSYCSLPRPPLTIPVDFEVGEKNYKELEKLKI